MNHPRSRGRRAASRSAGTAVPAKAGAVIHEHSLRNGLRVLLIERHSDPVVAVMLYYRVGTRNEREHEAGLSHFLEHMMFKGSKGFGKGEVDRLTALLGGSNNAFTSNDHTAYWFELASDRWEAALEIEADRMCHLTLDPEEFDAERAVVLEELAMGEDDPWRVMAKAAEAALFQRHPYARPIIGYADSLRKLDARDMHDYYGRFYHPGNAILVIAGDVKPTAALRSVRKHFGGIPAGADYAQADCYRPTLVAPKGEQRIDLTWDDSARRLCMVFPTVRVGTDDDFALDLVTTLLTSGRNSRLQRRLVLDRGLAVSVSSSNDTRVDGGIFWIFAQCAQGVSLAELESTIDYELELLAEQPVPAAELKRARAVLASSEAFDNETATDLAEEIGSYAVDADWRLALQGRERYAEIRPARLRAAVRKLLGREGRVVVRCQPRADAEDGA